MWQVFVSMDPGLNTDQKTWFSIHVTKSFIKSIRMFVFTWSALFQVDQVDMSFIESLTMVRCKHIRLRDRKAELPLGSALRFGQFYLDRFLKKNGHRSNNPIH